MSYVDARSDARSRLMTGGVVAGLQVALALAVLSGFAVRDFVRENRTPLASEFFPTTPPPKPVEDPIVEPEQTVSTTPPITAPDTMLDIAPPVTFQVAPVLPDLPTTPLVKLPQPSVPTVTPKPTSPAFEPVAARPRGDVGSWITTSDYPSRELREGHEGLVRFRLSVDARGRASDCAITGSSGYPALDQATCKYAMRRARFDPASDAAGQASAGTWDSAVRWVIPKD
ncbi:TonB family protein [Novosphingobium sp. YJ-S2-02]|uniref:TonB family protein n=1 Tax=Novosphingobium aureum TaxID=2792964 RepID=A0A931HEY3_9SPHN|nr:energy transducer TonB [Novosphingobium aureum]MBH0114875.1 TonB family protein [Novosphingobium aureum]